MRRLLLVGVLLCIVAASSCSGGSRSGGSTLTGTVTLATGGTAGVYYQYGLAVASQMRKAAPDLRVNVVATSGSIENLSLIADEKASCAFTAGDAAAQATSGREPFSAPIRLLAVARVYDDYLHLVATRSSGIRTPADLSGRRVSLGPKTSGTRLIVDRLLRIAKLAPARLRASSQGINESIEAMRAGHLDAFFWSGGVPTSGVDRLAKQVPLKIVALSSLAAAMGERFDGSYRVATVPPGTYGLTEGVMTLAVPNEIVCGPKVRADVVDLVLSTLFESRDAMSSSVPEVNSLDRRAAIVTSPVPLHPEAIAWYRRTKP